jgi:hypothetical protein
MHSNLLLNLTKSFKSSQSYILYYFKRTLFNSSILNTKKNANEIFSTSKPPIITTGAPNNNLSSLPDLTLNDFILMDKNIDITELRNEHKTKIKNKKHKTKIKKKENSDNNNNKKINPFIEYSGLNIEPLNYELYSKSRINEILNNKLNKSQLNNLNILEYIAASTVLPMRTNNYVINNLIEWNNIPNDPIFQLTFPQPGMLDKQHLDTIINTLETIDDNGLTIYIYIYILLIYTLHTYYIYKTVTFTHYQE